MNGRGCLSTRCATKGVWQSRLALILGLAISGCAPMMTEETPKPAAPAISAGPSVTVSPPVVEYKRKATVLISGSGFQPKQEVGLRIEMGGVITDISYLLRPPATTNEFGAFAGVWVMDDEIRAKMLTPTVYTLRAVDSDGKVLASAPLVFCDPKAKKKAAACEMILPEEKKKE